MEEAKGPSGPHPDQDYPCSWARQAGPPGEESIKIRIKNMVVFKIYISRAVEKYPYFYS